MAIFITWQKIALLMSAANSSNLFGNVKMSMKYRINTWNICGRRSMNYNAPKLISLLKCRFNIPKTKFIIKILQVRNTEKAEWKIMNFTFSIFLIYRILIKPFALRILSLKFIKLIHVNAIWFIIFLLPSMPLVFTLISCSF